MAKFVNIDIASLGGIGFQIEALTKKAVTESGEC